MSATILLVEPDLIDRADWQALLQFHGYKVFSAGNGKAALDRCAEIRPDLVLMDIGLPDISGFEVCRRLKTDPGIRKTPIILIESNSNRFKPPVIHGNGHEAIGERPVSREEALQRVHEILRGRTAPLFESVSMPNEC